jgi:hypothetical protein
VRFSKFTNYSLFGVEGNSMFENDVSSELQYKDLSMSDKGRCEDYSDLIIQGDIQIDNAEEDEYLFEM